MQNPRSTTLEGSSTIIIVILVFSTAADLSLALNMCVMCNPSLQYTAKDQSIVLLLGKIILFSKSNSCFANEKTNSMIVNNLPENTRGAR